MLVSCFILLPRKPAETLVHSVTIAGAFPFGTFVTSWATMNAGTDTTRASAVAAVLVGGNIGALVSTWTVLLNIDLASCPHNISTLPR